MGWVANTSVSVSAWTRAGIDEITRSLCYAYFPMDCVKNSVNNSELNVSQNWDTDRPFLHGWYTRTRRRKRNVTRSMGMFFSNCAIHVKRIYKKPKYQCVEKPWESRIDSCVQRCTLDPISRCGTRWGNLASCQHLHARSDVEQNQRPALTKL